MKYLIFCILLVILCWNNRPNLEMEHMNYVANCDERILNVTKLVFDELNSQSDKIKLEHYTDF